MQGLFDRVRGELIMPKSYAKLFSEISLSRLIFNMRKRYRREEKPILPLGADQHIRNLRDNGYSVIESYFSAEQCEQMRTMLDKAMEDYPDAIWQGMLGADNRIFGIEHIGGKFLDFFNDPYLRQIGNSYFDCRLENLQTLAARIDAIPGNIGSGEGWHKDANHFQFKVLVYLSDAKLENGPFQVIKGSHHYPQVVADSHAMQLDDPLITRFTDEQIARIVDRDPDRVATLTGCAGTAFLIDVSAIHRGSPIQMGRRYALFNYYYAYFDLVGREEKFTPRLRPEMVEAGVKGSLATSIEE